MSIDKRIEILKKLADISKLAGIKSHISEQPMHLEAGFSLPDGRSQLVFVRPTGTSLDDQVVVTFFSPCLKVAKGLLKGISKDRALDLLKRNENTMFARFGIWSNEKSDLIVASVDHLLETLDPDEFSAHMWHVAVAADEYEKEHGSDDY